MKPESENRQSRLERFKAVFDDNYQTIRSFIYYKTGDADLADDLVQETFLKLWDKWEKINIETVRPLLYTIAGNLVKNDFRRKKVEYNFVSNASISNSSEAADFNVESEEFNRLLQETLAGIPEKSRIPFLMNRIEKLSYREISERLGISVKGVEKRMNIALAHIRKRITHKF